MKKFFAYFHSQKTLRYLGAHKGIGAVVIVALLAAGYFGYRAFASTSGETRFVLAAVEKGTLITSVTGSGQVSASNQVDLKPKVSGDVIAFPVQSGQEVRAGQLIAQLDPRDADKTVRDAEVNLESAKIALEKLKKPADTLSILQAENALIAAKEAKQNAGDDLEKIYDDAFSAVANAFLELPTAMTGLQDMLYSSTIVGASTQWNIDYYTNAAAAYDDRALQYRDDMNAKYQTARKQYDKNFQDYKTASRFSDKATIEALLDETYATTKSIADAVKSANNLIQFYKDKLTERSLKPTAVADTHLTSLNSYTGETNAHLTSLLGVKNSIQNDRDTITSSDRAIAEKTESLAKLKSGVDPLDVQSQQLTLKQRENALRDAQEKLADYFIRAPFDGVIAKVNAKKSDSVSSATILATLITKRKLAEISLNEVDVAKVKIGERATLTFDAVEGLSITGQVAEIDTVGTVTQGVVTYSVKIGFDTQDDRIKPGMSVSAAIITNAKQDVLMIANSAVKTQGDTYYVEMLAGVSPQNQAATMNAGIPSSTPPRRQSVEIGLSNDSETEIISGLTEGDLVVIRTISPGAVATQSQQTNGLRLFGAPSGGGNTRTR